MVIEAEFVLKFVGSFTAFATLGRLVVDVVNSKKSKMRDEYKFAREFLESVKEDKDVHPFAMEKGYQAIAGSSKVKAKEIRYILELENASERLQDFVDGYDYLQHLSAQGDKEISFRAKYATKWKLNLRKYACFASYLVNAFLAFVPFVFQKELKLALNEVGMAMCFTVPIFIPYALHFLFMGLKIRSAQQFIELQSKRFAHNLK